MPRRSFAGTMSLAACLLGAAPANALPTVYTDEAAFIAALAALPEHALVHEGFEDDGAWGDARSTIAGGQFPASQIASHALAWRSNFPAGEITTGGRARTGSWGLFALPHGSYGVPVPGADCDTPGDCGDGFLASSGARLMYAFGGWVNTNTPFAKVGVFPGGYSYFGNQCDDEGIDCDAVAIGTGDQFLGVIDPDGFTQVEMRELEGKTEGAFDGDLKNIFADDFTIALAPRPVPVPLPAAFIAALALLLAGAPGRRAARRRHESRSDRAARRPGDR